MMTRRTPAKGRAERPRGRSLPWPLAEWSRRKQRFVKFKGFIRRGYNPLNDPKGTPIRVEMVRTVSTYFVVTRDLDGRVKTWNVSHLPTGYIVARGLTSVRQAQLIAAGVAGIPVAWGKVKPTKLSMLKFSAAWKDDWSPIIGVWIRAINTY